MLDKLGRYQVVWNDHPQEEQGKVQWKRKMKPGLARQGAAGVEGCEFCHGRKGGPILSARSLGRILRCRGHKMGVFVILLAVWEFGNSAIAMYFCVCRPSGRVLERVIALGCYEF